MIYVCEICGWEYDEEKGFPDLGIEPGTKWADVPEDFICLYCGASKEQFSAVGSAADLVHELPKETFDNKVLHNFSYGLFVLTAREGDKDNGCIINTAIQAASDPLQILICVNKANYTHDMILRTGKFNLSFLTEKSRFATFQNFGFQSGRDAEKLAQIAFRRAANGIAYLTEETNAYLSAEVTNTMDLGSHTLFVANVTAGEVLGSVPSVTYAYYFAHIKPKAQVKQDVQEEKHGWVCLICGYIYEGDPLPEDFICPICKHPASDFERF